MQLPKYKKKKRIKLKVCQFPECKKEFWGHPIAKYCDDHRDIKKRIRPKKEELEVEPQNLFFTHNFINAVDIKLICCLNGCSNDFNIRVYPKQFVYTRYCESHRNKYQRNLFKITQKKLQRQRTN